MDRPIVVVDTENARSAGAPHLVEIGAVRVADGEVAGEFATLVRPEVGVDPATTEVHGLTDEDLRQAPAPGEAVAAFLDWLGGDWLAAHRAEADARTLAFECERAQLAPPDQPMIDTLPLARRLIPEAPDHRLGTLREVLGLEDGPEHRALHDAVWCWRVLEACAERLDPPVTAARLLALGGRALSIASEAPAPRRGLKPRHRKLARACARREAVTILYGDTAEDPVPLEVRPILLFQAGERAYLEGECGRSGLLKTYRLDRVHRVRAR